MGLVLRKELEEGQSLKALTLAPSTQPAEKFFSTDVHRVGPEGRCLLTDLLCARWKYLQTLKLSLSQVHTHICSVLKPTELPEPARSESRAARLWQKIISTMIMLASSEISEFP